VTDAPLEEPPGDPRDALIREQAERIAVLEVLVADLRERLAAAERAGSRNSGNSSMPSSSDDLPGRKAPRDRAEDHYPQGNAGAAGTLADAADLGLRGRISRRRTSSPPGRSGLPRPGQPRQATGSDAWPAEVGPGPTMP
jgi:hypothetical protein